MSKMITQTKVQSCLIKISFVLVLSAVVFSCKKTDTTPVPKAPVISYNQKIVSVNVGEQIPTLIPDSSKGGSVTQYSIYPGLPKGLSLNQVNGVISGTPSDSLAPTRFIISAYSKIGIGHDTITIAVGTVGFVYGSTGNYVFTKGSTDLATTALAPTVLAGAFKKFFIDPNSSPNDLTSKTGLSFDQSTGKISGTPSRLTSVAGSEVPVPLTFVITGVTQDNKVAYDTIKITVNDVAPSSVAYNFKGSFNVNVAMGAALTPTASGTGPVVKYRLAPGSNPLPAGVHLDSTKGYIGQVYDVNTGSNVADIPTVPANTTVTIRAINTGGYQDIVVPIIINDASNPVTPTVKYMMSYLTGNVVDTICAPLLSGNTIYLTKSDGIGNTAIYLNPVVTAGQPKATSGYIITKNFAVGGMSLNATTGVYSGTATAAAGTYSGTDTIKNAAAGTDGTFGLNIQVLAPYFTYSSPINKGGTANTFCMIQNQKVDVAVNDANPGTYVYPGYTTQQLSPQSPAAGIIGYTIYPMSTYPGTTTYVPFAATGLTFNTQSGAISGTPTANTLNGNLYTSWNYLIVGKKADGSFTYYKIAVKIYQNYSDFGSNAM